MSYLLSLIVKSAKIYPCTLPIVPVLRQVQVIVRNPAFVLKPATPNFSKHNLNFCTRAYDVSTNVSKDVILYKYENPRFFKVLNFFGISQFIFWTYLSHFAFTSLRDAPVEQKEDIAWYERINLGENKYRNGISIMCFVIGYGLLFTVWMFTLRSVRFLILRKGGKEVSIVSYGPFGYNRIMDVPLKHVSAQRSREAAAVLLPLKVRNRSFFFVLDMRGEFKNARLYDYTVGLNRRF
uniref:Transmembrane protein 223 n=1 Tax=Glossina brevipalpis TaxID=37001 RepID=A0A1A9WYI8_9MUSC